MAGRIGRNIYRSKRWQIVRRKVIKRDGYRCRSCGRAGRLEVDHLVPIAQGGDPFDMSNLESKCRACHIGKTRNQNRQEPSPERAAWNRLVDAL